MSIMPEEWGAWVEAYSREDKWVTEPTRYGRLLDTCDTQLVRIAELEETNNLLREALIATWDVLPYDVVIAEQEAAFHKTLDALGLNRTATPPDLQRAVEVAAILPQGE